MAKYKLYLPLDEFIETKESINKPLSNHNPPTTPPPKRKLYYISFPTTKKRQNPTKKHGKYVPLYYSRGKMKIGLLVGPIRQAFSFSYKN